MQRVGPPAQQLQPALTQPERSFREPTPADEDASPSQPRKQPEQLSDYELFLARAEAEDRTHREQIWRNISQRSAAVTGTPALPSNYVKPNPHLQYASAPTESSTGTTALAGRTSAGGSKSSRGGGSQPQSQRNSGQYALGGSEEHHQQQQYGRSRGHVKRANWTPSYAAGGADAEKALEKQRAQPVTAMDEKVSATFEAANATTRLGEYQPQQPRTLRRQTSITQRIAEYIRPSREVGANYEPPVYRPGSRTGVRRSGTGASVSRAPQPIETLVE
ncbi:hypothetical protein QBC46DRAFT_324795 [Diplogelasinospora grovesii]|uniref:Uncharacterized protein n=1 Tax=Diplogelasinospora grovesii TaxID=303347 RepID=A0AAN6RZ80_9PEZI|nr:hypothetical protein QBC46DRAFT_324795 [Diplogelasinospora grovesii]